MIQQVQLTMVIENIDHHRSDTLVSMRAANDVERGTTDAV